MLNIFLIQPMKGKKITQILRERESVLRSIESKEEFRIINNVYEGPEEHVKHDGAWYLGKSLEALSYADIVLLYPGWENYDGCVIEYQCAIRNNIPIRALKLQPNTKENISFKKKSFFRRIFSRGV